MKKLVLILAVLVIAAPAMAVTLSLDNSSCDGWVSINYDKGAGVMPRAFALNVSVDGGQTITAYKDSVMDGTIQPFNVYMGNISIDNGVIVDRGSPVAPDTAPDTPDQIPAATIVIEMGSLYVPGTSDPCEPATSGTLIKLQVSADCNMTVTCNALRGNVVLEDTNVETPSVSGAVGPTAGSCGVCYTGADIAMWNTVGSPESWCNNRQCRGDADGLDEPYGNPALHLRTWVGNNDIAILVAGYKKAYTNPTDCPWIAADFDHLDEAYGNPALHLRCRVGNNDIAVLVANYKKSVPADCGQTAP